MHHKLDALASRLGFPFHPADRRVLETSRPRQKTDRCVQERPGVIEEVRRPAGPMSPSSPLVSGMQPLVAGSPPAVVPHWSANPSRGLGASSQFRPLC